MLSDPSTKDTSIKRSKFAGPNGVRYRGVPLYKQLLHKDQMHVHVHHTSTCICTCIAYAWVNNTTSTCTLYVLMVLFIEGHTGT